MEERHPPGGDDKSARPEDDEAAHPAANAAAGERSQDSAADDAAIRGEMARLSGSKVRDDLAGRGRTGGRRQSGINRWNIPRPDACKDGGALKEPELGPKVGVSETKSSAETGEAADCRVVDRAGGRRLDVRTGTDCEAKGAIRFSIRVGDRGEDIEADDGMVVGSADGRHRIKSSAERGDAEVPAVGGGQKPG